MGKIVKNYIYNFIYQIIVLFVPLVTVPYLARVLKADGVGTFGFVNSVTVLICTIVLMGIYTYGNRQIAYVRDDKEKLNNTFWGIMSARIIIAAVGTLVYAAVVFIIGRYHFLFLLYYSYLLGYFIDCSWLLVGMEDMKWAVIKNIIAKLIAVIGIFTLVRDEKDTAVYVIIQGGAVLFGNLIVYPQIKKYLGKPKLDFSQLKPIFKGSFILFLPSVAYIIYMQCDKIMIELITNNSAEVSFYDYSEKIVTIPMTFITVLSTVMMPKLANEFSKGHKEIISELVSKAANMSLFMAFPLMFGLIAISDKFVPWYLGDEFLPTVTAINVISPIIVSNTLCSISGNQYFTATNQIGILLKSQISAAIGNIILNAVLIPFYGFRGAAVATLVSSAVCAVIQYAYLVRQVSLKGVLVNGFKYLTASAFMFAAVKLITYKLPATALTNVIQALLGAALYHCICLAIKDKQLFYIFDICKAQLKKYFNSERL